MIDSPEKGALRALTLAVVKALANLNKRLQEEPDPKRDKKILVAGKELEVVNDEAMRVGLGYSAQQIARVKTSRQKLPPPPTADQKRGADHTALMRFHFDHIKGPIADGAAQGAAIKWLLEYYSVDVLRQCYEFQLKEDWRSGRVSWLTVKRDIGTWLNNRPVASPAKPLYSPDQAWEIVKKAAKRYGDGREISGLRLIERESPVAAETMRRLGCWRDLCVSADQAAIHNRFVTLYTELAARKEDQPPLSAAR